MKFKLKDLFEISRALEELGQCKTLEDSRMSYRLAKLRRDIAEEMKLFEASRKALVERLGGADEIKPGTPAHKEFQTEIEKILAEECEAYWIPESYDKFNPKNKLKLSEDFLFQTFELWTNPEDTPKEPKPEAP